MDQRITVGRGTVPAPPSGPAVRGEPTVRQRAIGAVAVGEIGLGGVHWSIADTRDDDLSVRTIQAAVDAGVTLIDTAHAYTTVDEPTHNESIVRRALAGYPGADRVLVATKGGHWRAGYTEFPIDGRPATLRAHLEASLSALGIERIGLYQLHHPDPAVAVEESIGALAEFQAEGLIDMIGVSNFGRELIDRARTAARIVSVQNYFSPFATRDLALIDYLAGEGIAYLPYSPLGGRDAAQGLEAALPRSAELARNLGVSLHRLVIAWHLQLAPNVIPIVGARRTSSILDSLGASEDALAPHDVAIMGDEIASIQVVNHAH